MKKQQKLKLKENDIGYCICMGNGIHVPRGAKMMFFMSNHSPKTGKYYQYQVEMTGQEYYTLSNLLERTYKSGNRTREIKDKNPKYTFKIIE